MAITTSFGVNESLKFPTPSIMISRYYSCTYFIVVASTTPSRVPKSLEFPTPSTLFFREHELPHSFSSF